ncbi:MAG TPA: glycerol-3-phosphate dehydrogenase/oxidase [Chloroflexota bacterium]|nr:glycerol-3-phosphate dehydrogenase/oxidase [Chloroflexota bacterium]
MERLRAEVFDVLVIGGGITGAGIALDAAARGLRVALVEKGDFASGTSSRSTKLVHGGLRYLAQYRFRLTREALSERSLLQRLAPHLVEPIPFLFPIYHKRTEVWRVNTGLWLYDLMAGLRRTKVHRQLTRQAVLQRAPRLNPQGLRAGFLYYDARTDDARLVVEVLKAAVEYGAVAANYVEAERVQNETGRAAGVIARDTFSGEAFPISARKVVVATGVWLDQILAASNLNDPSANRKRVRPAKGVHLIVPRDRMNCETAVAFPTPDNRLMFVIPWQGAVLIGTTDTDYDGPLDNPRANRADLDYILNVVNGAFPGTNLTDADVVSIQAGLRPLIDSGEETTAAVSREDKIFEIPDGTIAIAGGKLTTYRRMGRKVVDLVVARLRAENVLGRKLRSRTGSIRIGGYPENKRARFTRLTSLLRRRRGRQSAIVPPVTASEARRLWRAYGANWVGVLQLVRENPAWGEPIVPGVDVLRAEAVWAARHEMAQTLLDVLARRTHLAQLDWNQGRAVAAEIARLIAPDLGWDEAEVRRQVELYGQQVEQFSMEPLRALARPPGVNPPGDGEEGS